MFSSSHSGGECRATRNPARADEPSSSVTRASLAGIFSPGCEEIKVLLLRPVGSRRGLPLEAHHVSSILDCRLAYEIVQLVSCRVALGARCRFPKNLRIRMPR